LHRSEEGVAVSVPGLPGCVSQGANDDEALENIAIAIEEYLEAMEELTIDGEVRYVETVS
jgi:predicted RNase H-like HicB family nuclease